MGLKGGLKPMNQDGRKAKRSRPSIGWPIRISLKRYTDRWMRRPRMKKATLGDPRVAWR